MSAAERLELTEEEYLAQEVAADVRHEFLRGEVVAMAGGSKRHAKIAANIGGGLWGALKGTPCQPVGGDMRVHIPETGLYTYPDVMVVCGRWDHHERDPHSITNPKVIFEVLSPSTEAYDRGAKFGHYRRIASLSEYVLVSQDRRLVERFRRTEQGSWELLEYAESGEVPLTALGCALALDDIYYDAEQLADEAAEPVGDDGAQGT